MPILAACAMGVLTLSGCDKKNDDANQAEVTPPAVGQGAAGEPMGETPQGANPGQANATGDGLPMQGTTGGTMAPTNQGPGDPAGPRPPGTDEPGPGMEPPAE